MKFGELRKRKSERWRQRDILFRYYIASGSVLFHLWSTLHHTKFELSQIVCVSMILLLHRCAQSASTGTRRRWLIDPGKLFAVFVNSSISRAPSRYLTCRPLSLRASVLSRKLASLDCTLPQVSFCDDRRLARPLCSELVEVWRET